MKTLLIAITTLMVVAGATLANPAPKASRNWTGIVIHHSDSGPKTTRDDIDRWHRERGWDCIGYHYVIEWDGKIVDGRPLWKVGAHAKTGKPYSRNRTHIGICLVGRDHFTEAQLKSAKWLCLNLASEFNIKSVERHHEQCPGNGIDVESIDRAVKAQNAKVKK